MAIEYKKFFSQKWIKSTSLQDHDAQSPFLLDTSYQKLFAQPCTPVSQSCNRNQKATLVVGIYATAKDNIQQTEVVRVCDSVKSQHRTTSLKSSK